MAGIYESLLRAIFAATTLSLTKLHRRLANELRGGSIMIQLSGKGGGKVSCTATSIIGFRLLNSKQYIIKTPSTPYC
jgi:Tfp pilus assembly ATPase PilU